MTEQQLEQILLHFKEKQDASLTPSPLLQTLQSQLQARYDLLQNNKTTG
jgi:hypothetical protein